ncbi:MAG: 3-deoxy-D-manno-octulosonic acid transferase [Bacteroidales bacterium]
MAFIYSIVIKIFYLLILLFSTFNSKAKQWIEGRKNWHSKLKNSINSEDTIAWFHCASLGEFEQGRTLMEAYSNKNPNHKILITFFSPSGYRVRKDYKGADYVFYLPLDTRRNAKRFITIVKPKTAFFIKYEFWFHFLNELKRQDIPTYLVSAIFRPSQIFFKWYGGWNRRMLSCFTRIFLQDSKSKQLLAGIGYTNTTVAGDTRFDRVFATAKSVNEIPLIKEFCGDSTIIVAGSTWPKDEKLLIQYINTTKSPVKLIIAPHEISSQHVNNICSAIEHQVVRYTNPDENELKESKVLVLNTIGMLASAYQYGHIAYVGGGFGAGIHNTLEPATFGIPVIFGPNYKKFKEACELIDTGAGFTIDTMDQLNDTFSILLSSKGILKEKGDKAREYINQNIGATSRIINNIL